MKQEGWINDWLERMPQGLLFALAIAPYVFAILYGGD